MIKASALFKASPLHKLMSEQESRILMTRGVEGLYIYPCDDALHEALLDAAELLEVFQWSGADISDEGKQERIKEELEDVVNYCVLMADACGLDLDEIIQKKIRINNEKYPVEKAKGKSDKYSKL